MSKTISYVYVILSAVCWGFIGFSNRLLTEAGMTLGNRVFVRNFGALLVLTVVFALFHRQVFCIRLKHLPIFLGSGLISILLLSVVYFQCQTMCSLSVAAVLLYLAPSFVVLASTVLWKTPLTKGKIAALCVSLLGCIMVSGMLGGDMTASWAGIGLGVASGMCYASYTVFSHYGLAHYESYTMIYWTFLVAGLGSVFFADIPSLLPVFQQPKGAIGGICVVIVATVRALKSHGGVPKAELNSENLEALEKGLPNLLQHVDNVKNVYGLPCVVAINAFPTDTKAELDLVESKCRELGVNVRLSEVWAKGGEGGLALAEEVVRLCDEPNHFQFVYDVNDSIEDKLNAIATKVYHADGVVIAASAKKQLKQLTELGFDKLPICMAKTQFSFSDDASKLGAPRGFKITVRDLKVNAGAGFLVAKTGDIMTMPGLPKVPSAEKIDVDENGKITGLF